MERPQMMTPDEHGPSGNIFIVIGNALNAMEEADIGRKYRQEMKSRVTKAGSYQEALDIVQEYVDFV